MGPLSEGWSLVRGAPLEGAGALIALGYWPVVATPGGTDKRQEASSPSVVVGGYRSDSDRLLAASFARGHVRVVTPN